MWRAVDHEGEVLESFVTKTRDKKSALRFLKKTMKRYGRVAVFVTDKLRSYGAALKKIGASDRQETRRLMKIRTCHFDDGSGRCFGFDVCEVYRNSSPFTPRSAIILTRSVISTLDSISKPTAPLLSPSGVDSVRHSGRRPSPPNSQF